MIIAIGCDHAGFPIKERVCRELEAAGHQLIDHGCHSTEQVDFPDIAKKLCTTILEGRAERGIMLCGSGVGAAIACNKVPGIRASCCHDIFTAHQCVEHDDVQVACVGAEIVGSTVACELLHIFLAATFSKSEEFRRRVEKLQQMDQVK